MYGPSADSMIRQVLFSVVNMSSICPWSSIGNGICCFKLKASNVSISTCASG